MCDRKSIGDEYHYIMECTYFSNERKILLPSRFHKNHNTFKFNELMNSGNIETLKSLSRLIKKNPKQCLFFLTFFPRLLHYFVFPFFFASSFLWHSLVSDLQFYVGLRKKPLNNRKVSALCSRCMEMHYM